jgi:hypothetical protein
MDVFAFFRNLNVFVRNKKRFELKVMAVLLNAFGLSLRKTSSFFGLLSKPVSKSSVEEWTRKVEEKLSFNPKPREYPVIAVDETVVKCRGPTTLTPADYWFDFVSNESQYGDWAIYSNPSVVQCANAFTSTTNISYIQYVCAAAQKQIYDQAPYAWLGVSGLWYGADSLAWKTSVIKGFLVDPVWDGQDTAPIFNTVIFTNST